MQIQTKCFIMLCKIRTNFTLVLIPISLNQEVRLLSDVEGVLIVSSDNLLVFDAEIWSVLPIYLKCLYIAWKNK